MRILHPPHHYIVYALLQLGQPVWRQYFAQPNIALFHEYVVVVFVECF